MRLWLLRWWFTVWSSWRWSVVVRWYGDRPKKKRKKICWEQGKHPKSVFLFLLTLFLCPVGITQPRVWIRSWWTRDWSLQINFSFFLLLSVFEHHPEFFIHRNIFTRLNRRLAHRNSLALIYIVWHRPVNIFLDIFSDDSDQWFNLFLCQFLLVVVLIQENHS